jgi:hypothetical protein
VHLAASTRHTDIREIVATGAKAPGRFCDRAVRADRATRAWWRAASGPLREHSPGPATMNAVSSIASPPRGRTPPARICVDPGVDPARTPTNFAKTSAASLEFVGEANTSMTGADNSRGLYAHVPVLRMASAML